LSKEQIEEYLQILDSNNCSDCSKLRHQPDLIPNIVSALYQVKKFYPDFLQKPWTTKELLNKIINEHNQLENYIDENGCEDLPQDLSLSDLLSLSNTLVITFKEVLTLQKDGDSKIFSLSDKDIKVNWIHS
jgi:hypothetical protein